MNLKPKPRQLDISAFHLNPLQYHIFMFRRPSPSHKQSSQLLALTNFLSPLLCFLKSIQELMVWEVRSPSGGPITIIFQIDIMLNCLHIYLYTTRLVRLSVPILEASLWRRNQLIQRLTLTPLQRLSLENTGEMFT